MLAREGVEFLVQPAFEVLIGRTWRRLKPDILVPSERLAIEVNGCFVHGCPVCYGGRGRARFLKFEQKIRALKRAGWNVHVVWEHELTHEENYMNHSSP